MKRRILFISLICILGLCGCARSVDETINPSVSVENIQTPESQEQEVSDASEESQKQKAPDASEESQEKEALDTVEESQEAETTESSNIEYTEPEPNWIFVVNPSWDEYYVASGIESDTKPYELKQVEQKTNNISDANEWFENNGLSKQSWAMDSEYSYTVGGEGVILYLYQNGKEIACLDFLEYEYARIINEGEEFTFDILKEYIHWAIVEDDVLYVSISHDTYAESEPANAYIVAIDLTDYSVLWKTAPLTSNAWNFEIVDDVIFCGYGFTNEDDYLYQLDKKTGEVISQEKLKSRADYIIYKDGNLYIHTYNTDYVYEVVGAEYAGLDIDRERLIEEQSFPVDLDGWGKVQFVSYLPKDESSDVEFRLLQQGKEAYILPDAWNTGATFLNVEAVAFRDYNEDGKTDIITICKYSDNYEDEIYNVSTVYLQKEQAFEIDPLLHEYLQKQGLTESIKDIVDRTDLRKQG